MVYFVHHNSWFTFENNGLSFYDAKDYHGLDCSGHIAFMRKERYWQSALDSLSQAWFYDHEKDLCSYRGNHRSCCRFGCGHCQRRQAWFFLWGKCRGLGKLRDGMWLPLSKRLYPVWSQMQQHMIVQVSQWLFIDLNYPFTYLNQPFTHKIMHVHNTVCCKCLI